MADISLFGHIEGIRVNDTFIVVRVSERRAGYRRKDGVVVKEELLSYRVMFKSFLRKYIQTYFDVGSLVRIKGVMLPYVKGKDGEVRDGFTILGQTIDMAAYPNRTASVERRMLKESEEHSLGSPDLDGFMENDF